jgi:transcription factor SPEECHLESS
MPQGDQASIIGGVVDYIKELQQVLRSLEAKKNRKAYADQVLSPRLGAAAASPRPLVKSMPPISPRVAVPISPRTPTQPGSPYNYVLSCGAGGGTGRPPHPSAAAAYMMTTSPAMTPTASSTSCSSPYHPSSQDNRQQHCSPYLPALDSIVTELAAHAAARAAALPDVKMEFAGPNLVLKTVSRRAPGQALKIIAALESLSLEILHISVSTVDETMVHSFTIKVYINLLALFLFNLHHYCGHTMIQLLYLITTKKMITPAVQKSRNETQGTQS